MVELKLSCVITIIYQVLVFHNKTFYCASNVDLQIMVPVLEKMFFQSKTKKGMI